MLNWTTNGNQFESAIIEIDKKEYFIKVELVQEEERKQSALMQNIATSDDSLMLKTDYTLPYNVGNNIKYRGKWRVVKAIGTRSLDINPQVLGYAVGMTRMQYILEVV